MFIPRCQYSLAAQNDTRGGRPMVAPTNKGLCTANRPPVFVNDPYKQEIESLQRAVGEGLAPPAFYFNIPQNKKRAINDRPYRTTLNFVGVDALGVSFYITAHFCEVFAIVQAKLSLPTHHRRRSITTRDASGAEFFKSLLFNQEKLRFRMEFGKIRGEAYDLAPYQFISFNNQSGGHFCSPLWCSSLPKQALI